MGDIYDSFEQEHRQAAPLRELQAELASLRADLDEAVAAMEEIDALGADHGHWEAAAKTAQEIARAFLTRMAGGRGDGD